MSLTRSELKDIQSLVTKKGRKQKKQFLAEGVRLLEEAVRHRVRPEVVYYAEALLSERAAFLVNTLKAQHLRAEAIPARQLESMADTEATQGVLGIFPYPSTALGELKPPRFRKVLLCERIADPGNLGTLIRSALAFDFDMVMLSGQCAEPFSPKVVRSSAGAVFGLPISESATSEALHWMRANRCTIVAANLGGETVSSRLGQLVSKQAPLVLAIGSESSGLSDEIRAAATWRVRIDHANTVESLNAAVAGSILMKEVFDLLK